jgi:hypothetical protein
MVRILFSRLVLDQAGTPSPYKNDANESCPYKTQYPVIAVVILGVSLKHTRLMGRP